MTMKKITSLTGYLFFASLSIFVANCVSLPIPATPVDVEAYKGKQQADREKKYRENLIDSEGRGYKVNGVALTEMQMTPLFSASYTSENTRKIYSSASNWGTAGGIFTGVGSGVLGWMIGLQLSPSSSSSSGKSIKDQLGPSYLWGVGGGFLAVGIVFYIVATNKLTAASQSYNEDLFRALELQQKTSLNPVPLHEQYAHHTMSWGHRF
jgi:hypothetical protein